MTDMPTSPIPAPAPLAGAASGRSLHILYADDTPELRNLMRDMLARHGHKVETVDDGDTALIRLQQPDHGFDVIITDHNMPHVNGLELVRQTRAAAFPGKIVVFTSETSDEVHEQYRKFAVDAILPKPIFPVTFRNIIEQMFNAVRPPDDLAIAESDPLPTHA